MKLIGENGMMYNNNLPFTLELTKSVNLHVTPAPVNDVSLKKSRLDGFPL